MHDQYTFQVIEQVETAGDSGVRFYSAYIPDMMDSEGFVISATGETPLLAIAALCQHLEEIGQ